MNRFCLPLLILLPAIALAQLDTVWLRTVDGGPGLEDVFSDLYVDDSGYIYITGTTATISLATDIFVRKYRPDGSIVWTATYNGRANQDDSASAVVVDSAGNVFVCGWTIDTVMDMDMVTIKYSPAGQLLWAKTWSRAFNRDDAAHDLVLDRLGRVIVTGYCSDADYNIDYCTICYRADNGDTVWVRYYNRTPENDEDIPYSICVDDSNNIYVTGTSYDDGTDYDIATIRYRPNGTQQWLRRKNNWPWVGDDYGMKVVFDPSTRSIVVGGIVWDDNQDYNYFAMKYRAATGESLWARAYNRYPANNEDLLSAVSIDASGNVYVTGTSFDDVTDYDIATVSYTSAGLPRWTQRYDAEGWEDAGADLAVDSTGQIFVLGTGESRTSRMDLTILKYLNDGTPLYSWRWNNPISHNEDWGYRIALRRGGQLIAAGTTFSDSTNVDLLLKLYEIQHDLAVSALIVPESLYIAETLFPQAIIQNLAINTDSGRAYLKIEPGAYLDSIWLVLTPGAAETINFTHFRADTAGIYTVSCWVYLAADERRFNDTLIAALTVWEESTAIAESPAVLRPLTLTITPNPVRTHGLVDLNIAPENRLTLKLFDRTGALIREFAIEPGNGRTRFQLDLKEIPAGVYFLRLDQPATQLTRKVVIQH
jgi:uncharacterized delta-60 repeat protein